MANINFSYQTFLQLIISPVVLLVTLQFVAGQPVSTGKLHFETVRTFGIPNQSHTGPIKNVKLIDSTHAITCAEDGTVGLWDLETEKMVRRFVDDQAGTLYCQALTTDKKWLLTAGSSKRVLQFNFESGEIEHIYEVGSTVMSIDLCPDGQSFLVGDDDGHVSHWKMGAEKAVCQHQIDEQEITALRCLPDGSGFVFGNGNGTLVHWKFEAEKPAKKTKPMKSFVCCLQISPDQSQIAACDYNGAIGLWEADSLKKIWLKKEVADEMIWLRFWQNKHLLAVDGADRLFKIERATGDFKQQTIDMPDNAGFDLSADQTVMYAGGQHSLTGWNVESGKRVFPATETYLRSGPVNELLVIDDIMCSIGSQPIVQGTDLATGQTVFEKRIDFKTKSADSEANDQKPVVGKQVQLIPFGSKVMAAVPDGYAVLDLDNDQAITKFHRSALTHFRPAANPEKLLGINEKNQQVVEFVPFQDRKQRSVIKSENYRFNFFAISEHFLLITHRNSLTVNSLKTGEPIRQKTVEGFDFENVVAQSGWVLSADDKQLIGFAAPRLESDSNLTEQEIKQLVQQLNDSSYQQREQATLALAAGGLAVLEQAESSAGKHPEVLARIGRVRRLIETENVPELSKMARWESGDYGKIETIAIQRQGEYWLATTRDTWKSILHSGRLVDGEFVDFNVQPLRSRATKIKFDSRGNPVIGYADGSIDQLRKLN